MAKDLKAQYAGILLRPRITEKANLVADKNVHTFEVARLATKSQVSKAIEAFYKVVPVKVRMVKNPAKKVVVRGKRGIKAGVKKAYVYLKAGDKIE